MANIAFIHVDDGECNKLFCTDMIEHGRLNPWLLALRLCITAFVLNITRSEYDQLKKKGSVSEYFSDTQNKFDFLTQVTFVAAVALDTKHKASDYCLIFYALNFFIVLVVFTY